MLFIYIENDAFSKFELTYSGLKQFDIIKGYYRDKEFSESVKFLVFHDWFLSGLLGGWTMNKGAQGQAVTYECEFVLDCCLANG